MFTGIIEEIGAIEKVVSANRGKKLGLRAKTVLAGLQPDDSISVNGICLTVTRVHHSGFEADAVEETMKKTTVGFWAIGKKVNLERAIRADGRFGGHFVQGHVDGTGKVVSIQTIGQERLMDIEIPAELSQYVIHKGSITVDGVSLTVADLCPHGFSVALIPHTLEKTNLGLVKTGDSVNIETDVLGKYVEKMMHPSVPDAKKLNENRMRELGY